MADRPVTSRLQSTPSWVKYVGIAVTCLLAGVTMGIVPKCSDIQLVEAATKEHSRIEGKADDNTRKIEAVRTEINAGNRAIITAIEELKPKGKKKGKVK